MRKYLFLALVAVLGLASCDSNKSKIEELTNQFASAVKSNDVATIYDMYPDAKQLDNMKLPSSIEMADIDVEKDEKTGNYTATIKNSREQKLVFKPTGEKTFQISNSYGLFEIDKTYSDLAVSTGVPLKKLSDLELCKLLKDDGDFISFIQDKYSSLTELDLSYFDGRWVRNYRMVSIDQNIKNDGDFAVKGKDYDVVFYFKDNDGVDVPSTKTMEGVDLAPGETFTYNFQVDGYSNATASHTLTWTVKFNQKGGNAFKDLLKKAKFTGEEYSEFLKQQKSDSKSSKE